MKEERESLIFYRSFYEAIKELNFEQQWEIYNSIFQYWLDFIEPKLKWISKTIFTLIRPQLDANIRKYHNWNKPKDKQNESKTQAKNKQNESKTQGNVNVNENVNKNVNKNNYKGGVDLQSIKIEITKFIEHWNNLYKEKRQVTPRLLEAYKKVRKDYTKEQFVLAYTWYNKKKEWVEDKTKHLEPLTFLIQSNWFIKYL